MEEEEEFKTLIEQPPSLVECLLFISLVVLFIIAI